MRFVSMDGGIRNLGYFVGKSRNIHLDAELQLRIMATACSLSSARRN
jgi:hypothetical protein